jgi:transcription initiation factor TFIIIB Brf1 subunit/transcription initiation factor TFIIB
MKLYNYLILIFATFLFSSNQKKVKIIVSDAPFSHHIEPVFLSKSETWSNSILEGMTLEDKIAQFFMLATWPNKDEIHQNEIENLIKKYKIGG